MLKKPPKGKRKTLIISRRSKFLELDFYKWLRKLLRIQGERIDNNSDKTLKKVFDAPNKSSEIEKMVAKIKRLQGVSYPEWYIRKYVDKYFTKMHNWSYKKFCDTFTRNYGIDLSVTDFEEKNKGFLQDVVRNSSEKVRNLLKNGIDKYSGILYEAIVNGSTYKDVEGEVKKNFNKGFQTAARMARTDMENARSRMEDRWATEAGCKYGFWRGALDDRERESHIALEGKRYEIEKGIEVSPGKWIKPGEEPNCRCYTEYDVWNDVDND